MRYLPTFIMATIFLIAVAAVAPSIEKATMLMVGVPTLALSLLAARYAKIGKLAAALPLVLAVWFLSARMGATPDYSPSVMNFWAGVLALVIVVSVIIAKRKKVVEKPVRGPAVEQYPHFG